jgi:diaminopimelate epimerase
MTFTFFKYQATGNDFIVVDNRQNFFDKNDTKLIKSLCDRRFGIGADGLILLEHAKGYDFKMIYFNADGRESTMCGNGGRSIVHFSKYLGIIDHTAIFLAIDGHHKATIKLNDIALNMSDVTAIERDKSDFVLNTGSPHYVTLRSNLSEIDVAKEGAQIRYGEPYNAEGINVNFVEQSHSKGFDIRTYERGVENETLSCGTGATAAAIAMHASQKTSSKDITLNTKGGPLKVQFNVNNETYNNIWLTGPAELVFQGTYSTNK